ncbi:hypothetical protein CQW23_12444 [Capsicum baccatum]|uniref:Uncharacterized protein n=1 Tax=Capsicum baccatum TaxID=33114 RepID=A0A2G2WSJ6_CAPBA|nr:hypothetical protein CQW23_12444 [Capsicum baccatum]
MEIANQAKIDVAEANKKEAIGEKIRDRETKQNSSKIDAEIFIISAKRQEEGKKEEYGIRTEAEVDTENVVEIREAKLQMEVEKKKAFVETAKIKDDLFSKANVEHDIKVFIQCMPHTRSSGQPLLPINPEPQCIGRMEAQHEIERMAAQQEQARLAALAAAQVHQ